MSLAAEPVLSTVLVEVIPALSVRRVWLEPEQLGLAATLMELNLGDVREVLPRIRGAKASPSVAPAEHLITERWTATLQIQAGGGATKALAARVCDPLGRCQSLTESVGGTDLAPAAARLSAAIATALGRSVSPAVVMRWSEPVSRDPYAATICGRAAARQMDLLPPTSRELWGDRRRDPLTRAMAIDPGMVLCQWLAGRRGQERKVSAATHLERAENLAPERVLILADRAVAQTRTGALAEATTTWNRLKAITGKEHRFALARVESLILQNRHAEALATLDAAPAAWQVSLAVILLRVRIADAGGPLEDPDALFAAWQAAAPKDPEPVRRRIWLRVSQGRYAEALPLTSELTGRGEPEEAQRISVAVAVAAGRLADAERWAREGGDDELAARIAARRRLEAPSEAPEETSAATSLATVKGPAAALERAKLHAASARWAAALRELDQVREGALLPDALRLRAEILDHAGSFEEAARVRQRYAYLDPASAEEALSAGPMIAPGNTGSGVHAQSSPP